MEDHIRELLNRYQYSEEVKEAVAFRVLFGGEDGKQIMQELGIHSIQTIHHWVSSYQQKIELGLIFLPPMNEKQKQNVEEACSYTRQHKKPYIIFRKVFDRFQFSTPCHNAPIAK